MDLTYSFDDSVVHMRSRGVIIKDGRLLCLRDIFPYWYQVGGRISYGETSLEAIHREIHEELHIDGFKVVRPLFLDEHTVFRHGRKNQEFVIYYLIDIDGTDLLSRGDRFETIDDDKNIHHEWAWLTEDEIREYAFYPEPVLNMMFNLPEKFMITSTHEDEFHTSHDMTFHTEHSWFNIRTAAVFMHDGKLLLMEDGKAPFMYMPGGRLHFGETLEEGIKREVKEELQIEPHLIRPLRISQNFFESVNHPGEMTHEWCFYYLFETTDELLKRGDIFITHEEQDDVFTWVPLSELKDKYVMPPFLRTKKLELKDGIELTVDRS